MTDRPKSLVLIMVGLLLALSACGSDGGDSTRTGLSENEPPVAEDTASPIPTQTPIASATAAVPNPTETLPSVPDRTATPLIDPDPTETEPELTLPPVAVDEQVILFGIYEGDAISSTTIAGQDEVTYTGRVVIEEGDTPLYVILSSYGVMIWRFEGAVSRVNRVVLLGWGARGVTGVAAERVSDRTGLSLNYFDSVESTEAATVRDAVERALGRSVDVMAGSYEIGTVSFPSATVTQSPMPPFGSLPSYTTAYILGLFFNPGGVVDIAPDDVVSATPAVPYEVLPEGFGLAQLIATGGLEARDGYFYIARAIPRFPAGLYGAHLVTFVLGQGVPMPAGSPGHSCVVSEETGLAVDEYMFCPYLPPPPATCDLPEPAATDQVVLFGAYEGDAISTATVAGQDGVTDTARVVIEPGTTPLYVVLSAFESMIWRFEGETSRVARVVLASSAAQGATGLSADVVTDFSGVDCIRAFTDVQSPEGVAARRVVEIALGRPADIVASSYGVGAVSLPSAMVEASIASLDVPPGFDMAIYQTLGQWFSPGGVIDIDPTRVIARAPAEAYEVLPQAFGLAQLVATGALQNRDFTFVGGYFYIARAIPRFPAGLHGAHSVTFVLGNGVPLPAGSPGHSCVIAEETGLPIEDNSICSILPEPTP